MELKKGDALSLSKGYKQTEIGPVPNDWKTPHIPEIVSKNYGMKIGPFGSQLKKELLTDSGYKVYGQENVFDKNMIIGNRYINKDHFDKLRSCELKSGDFIISMMGTIGKTMIVPNNIETGIMDSHLLRLRLNNDIVIPELIQHYFSSIILLRQVTQLSVGGIMAGLSSKIIKNIFLPLPPTKSEQTAIATALSDTDALISSLEKLIEKKRNIKQGSMQQLLKPKKGWVVKKLGDCAQLKARIGWQGLTTAEYRKNGDYYLITGTEFKNGFVDWDSCHHVDEIRYVQDKYIQIREKDVLVTKDGTIGKIALIKNIIKPATLNSGVFVIRPIYNAFDSEFFYYLLLSKYFTSFLSQLTAGSTINHLYQKDFVTFIFSVPSIINEQKEIATILSDMDNEISSLEKKLSKSKMLKQGMMQELLTGKIRLV